MEMFYFWETNIHVNNAEVADAVHFLKMMEGITTSSKCQSFNQKAREHFGFNSWDKAQAHFI